MKKAVLIFMLVAKASFSQCVNAEKQYEEKVKEMIELCEKMKSVVPCAVGYSPNDYPHLDKVLSVASANALMELAINREAIVQYRSKDSAYTESDFYKDEDVAKRLGESVGKVKAEQIIKNTKPLKGECFSFTKNGKTLYRGASLRVFAELYDEWERKANKECGDGSIKMFTDQRDNRKYETMCIGDHVWFLKDLAYKSNDRYNWQSAKDVCPDGWRLPTNSEWNMLRADASSKDIKEFSKRSSGNWWSATEKGGEYAYRFRVSGDSLEIGNHTKTFTCAVRCVKF